MLQTIFEIFGMDFDAHVPPAEAADVTATEENAPSPSVDGGESNMARSFNTSGGERESLDQYTDEDDVTTPVGTPTSSSAHLRKSSSSISSAKIKKALSRTPSGKELFVQQTADEIKMPDKDEGPFNLLNNALAITLLSFTRNGLIETLVELGRGEAESASARIATQLLDNILRLADVLLPPTLCAQLHALPTLVEHATDMNPAGYARALRARASTMLTNLQRVTRKTTNDQHLSIADYHVNRVVGGGAKFRRGKGVDRRKDQIDKLKLMIDIDMADAHLQTLIKESKIPSTKEPRTWDWDVISELLHGPLYNPDHLATCLKTKFFRRLLSFYRPSRKDFINLPWSPANMHFIKVACQAMQILLTTPAGRDFLSHHKFFTELIQTLRAELKPANNVHARVLTEQRTLSFLSREYFTMVGTLTASDAGLALLNNVGLLQILDAIASLEDRDDLVRILVASLDYNINGPTRTLLSKILSQGTNVTRLFATRHMRLLLRAGVADFHDWGIGFLTTQLSDPDERVVRAALSVIQECVEDEVCLESLVRLRPSLFKKMAVSRKEAMVILLKFLSVPSGLQFLQDLNWIEPQMKAWHDELHLKYALALEEKLLRAMNPCLSRVYDDDDGMDDVGLTVEDNLSDESFGAGAETRTRRVRLPVHFYGELAATENGCKLLAASGHVDEFLASVKTSGASPAKRAALWSLGHIGSTPTGFSFLADRDLVPLLVDLAESSPVLSLRGTAFYVLGMVSRHDAGRAALEARGWESPGDQAIGISVPKNLDAFLHVPEYQFAGTWATLADEYRMPEYGDERDEILKNIVQLSNHIVQESGCKALRRLRASAAKWFKEPAFLWDVVQVLGWYRFRLPARQFIHNLFEPTVLEPTVWVQQS